jgi:hypothetical protein
MSSQIIQPLGPEGIVNTITHGCARMSSATTYSSTQNWIAANRAYYVRVILPRPVNILSLFWINGSAVAGNIDIGIYDGDTLKKIVTSGSIARSGTNALQRHTPTNPILLKAGVYFFAHSSDTTTNSRTVSSLFTSVAVADLVCLFAESSAFPLPDPITPASVPSGTNLYPLIGAFTDKCGL